MQRKSHLAALVIATLAIFSSALMASPALAQPGLEEANPADGARRATVPEAMHLCFTEPVKIESDDDWAFTVTPPSGGALGLRIVFQPSGECVDVYPGTVSDAAAKGDWTFDWAVHSQATGEEGSGTIKFNVGEGGTDDTPAPSGTAQPSSGSDEGGSDTVLVVLIAAAVVLAVGGGGAWLWARRRQSAGSPPQGPGRRGT